MTIDAQKNEDRQSDPNNSSNHLAQKRTTNSIAPLPFLLTFLILFAFWLIFSGKFDPFHIILGIVSCLIVAAVSSDLFFPSLINQGLFMCWVRFIRYIPWLLYQVFLANLYLLYLTFHPKILEKIDPHIITFDSHLKSDIARTTFANSITLTPGTITVSASIMGKFSVHCINRPSGQALPGEMERRIGDVFKE
jgi:multicomponent Na+:H+ antiporter subunit E